MFEQQRAPSRQVRAARSGDAVRVYVACAPEAAEAAVADQVLAVRETTWLEPSFRSVFSRSGSGAAVLAVDLTPGGFEWALAHTAEWDAERDLQHRPLNFDAVRLAVRGEAVARFADWVVAITDVTPLVRRIAAHLRDDELHEAVKLVPHEPPYPSQAEPG